MESNVTLLVGDFFSPELGLLVCFIKNNLFIYF